MLPTTINTAMVSPSARDAPRTMAAMMPGRNLRQDDVANGLPLCCADCERCMAQVVGDCGENFIHDRDDQRGDHHCQHDACGEDAKPCRLVDSEDRNRTQPTVGERRESLYPQTGRWPAIPIRRRRRAEWRPADPARVWQSNAFWRGHIPPDRSKPAGRAARRGSRRLL